ncbi:MAG: hypothetical protein ACYSWO_21485 [Planctomycetota bacterium]
MSSKKRSTMKSTISGRRWRVSSRKRKESGPSSAKSCGIISVVNKDLRLLMVELTTIMLSVKIIYLIHCQMRVNHFKFWILSAIEWRINEIMVHIKQLRK